MLATFRFSSINYCNHEPGVCVDWRQNVEDSDAVRHIYISRLCFLGMYPSTNL